MIITHEAALSLRCCGPMPCGKLKVKTPPERTCVGEDCMGWREDSARSAYGYCGLARQPDLDSDRQM